MSFLKPFIKFVMGALHLWGIFFVATVNDNKKCLIKKLLRIGMRDNYLGIPKMEILSLDNFRHYKKSFIL